MSDDWNLKDKGYIDIPDLELTPSEYNKWKIREAQSLARPSIIGEFKTDKDIKVYSKDVIEFLRQKLIEDIKEEFIQNKLSGYVLNNIEKKLNKRFGVEE